MIIGLTGRNCAGKGEAANYLQKSSFIYYSLSDILREDLVKAGLPETRENLIAFGKKLREEKGLGVLALQVLEKIDPDKNYVIDSIRHPAVIFTDPEVATVGLSESEAKEKGYTVKVGQFPFAANGRALSVNEPDGLVKMIGDAKTGRLLGVHIVGAEASNLIAEAALAIEMGAQVEDLALTVHAHPTLPETLMEAAEATLGHAIHIFQKKS